MTHTYSATDMSELYRHLEDFVKDEINRKVDDEFRQRYPGEPHPIDWSKHADRPQARHWLQLRDKILGAWANGTTLMNPPTVIQPEDMHCWAAGLESWLWAAKQLKVPQGELRKRYGLPKDGALDLRTDLNAFQKIANQYAMAAAIGKGVELTYGRLLNLLNHRGYLYLMYRLGGEPVSHTLVVFGVYIGFDSQSQLHVMDPSAEHGGSVQISLAYLRKSPLVLIACKR